MEGKNYKHILVPLDTSELAELALADALGVAKLSQAEITLLHVVAPIEDVLITDTEHPIYIDQQWEAKRILALEYFEHICTRMNCEGIKINRAAEMGQPAEVIINYARYYPVDLIVMATHGRSGFKRLVYGSVADKVLRGADVPVLLVRAHPEMEDTSVLLPQP
jgi:nucleotide-binding universal stress UspA family protein